jgi:TolB protein
MDRTPHTIRLRPAPFRSLFAALLLLPTAALVPPLHAQDNIFTGTNSGATSIRIAVADFKPQSADAQSTAFKLTFDNTLYADLANAGIFDIVSKSLMPPGTPGTPSEIQLTNYANAPANAAMLVFGAFAVTGDKLVVNGFLFDTKNPQYPQVLAKHYSEAPTDDSARQVAHRFADEIIYRLGGGVPGIAETKIFYVKMSGSLTSDMTKEIWQMDYDGANQHPITHLGTVVMSPRVSPDNTRLAFASLGKYGFQLKMYSLILGRYVNFPTGQNSSASPAWSPNGNEIAYSGSSGGPFNIWIADSNGNLARRVTSFHGDTSPTYNPKTGDQIAFISGRTGLPQLYIMNSDGSSVQRLTDQGYASSPSWSPDGRFLTFAWDRKYGPGAPGGQDIYIAQVTPNADGSYLIKQLTHDGGRCDFPSWSPDSKHIVYANSADGRQEHMRIWTMLSDGTQQHPITGSGADMPNWSWK